MLEDDISQFKGTVKKYKENEVIKKYNSNAIWDVGLTVSAIVFVLLATFTGTLGDTKLINENSRKLLTGTFGAISVAVQAVASRFPVKERAKGYRKIQMKLHDLVLRLEVNKPKSDDELARLLDEYQKIIESEGDIP